MDHIQVKNDGASTGQGNSGEIAARLDGVDVTFGSGSTQERSVLRGVDLEVRRGEFLVIVGKSGCGKTTVLNLLAGLVEPSSGMVSVLGGSPIKARPMMSYMFARDALLPWRSAVRNVEFGLELQGMAKVKRREVAESLLRRLGLENSANLYPWQLSQGMRQRVALARTWARDPQMLLMDEPFAALDAQTRVSAQAEFLRIWSEDRKTVVFVTHDLNEAVLLGDRIIAFGDGQPVTELIVPFSRPRSAAELVSQPAYQTLLESLHATISL